MYIIGITGGSGSGKSSIVEALSQSVSKDKITVLSQDRYYLNLDHLSPEERSVQNFDHPDAFDYDLLLLQLSALKSGQPIEAPVYSYVKETRESFTELVRPTPILLLEGILLMNHEEIRSLVDLWVYVDTDEDHRLMRRVLRDTKERGQELTKVFKRYASQVKPMHENYIASARSKADLVINNNEHYQKSVDFLSMGLKHLAK